jgi:multiple sugar transport system ATP-binding protein
MTAYDNMAFSLRMRGFSKGEIEKRVRETSDILGLEELLQRKPRELSGRTEAEGRPGKSHCQKAGVFLSMNLLSNLTPSSACICVENSSNSTID